MLREGILINAASCAASSLYDLKSDCSMVTRNGLKVVTLYLSLFLKNTLCLWVLLCHKSVYGLLTLLCVPHSIDL